MKVSHYFWFCETDMQTGRICLQNEPMVAVCTQFSFILKVCVIVIFCETGNYFK